MLRKGIVSCKGKERILQYVNEEVTSICDVIGQVKKTMEPAKSYSLNLQDNALTNDAALEILEFVKKTPQIKKLDLSANLITRLLDTSKIEEVCRSFVSDRKDCQVILTGNNIYFHFEQEDEEPKKSAINVIVEAF